MAGIEPRGDVQGGQGWMDLRLARLRGLRNALASEITVSSERGELMSPSSQAVMMARDALNIALADAGSEDNKRWEMVREAYRRFLLCR